MPKKQSYITITDQFCGAGGSSQGARRVAERIGGVEIKLALNHWKLAIETHNTNFPDTLHDCTDISACDPRRYPSTDILITSPECTNHSLGKGVKAVRKQLDLFDKGILDPAAERSRATMWDVCRFAEFHRYRIIIMENVVEARKWLMWEPWLHAMDVLGYRYKCIFLNSMHAHPTPQSRDRMYVVFWQKGQRAPDLEYTPEAYCPKCEKNVLSLQTWKNSKVKFGKYRTQYVFRCPSCAVVVEPYYYAAFNCIDFSDLGKRIGDRAKPLAENTMRRIQHGLKKYANHPTIITTRYTSGLDCRVRPAGFDVLPTQPGDLSHAILTPLVSHGQYGGKIRALSDQMFTQTCQQSFDITFPPMMIQAEHSKVADDHKIRLSTKELQTQTTCQSMGIAIPPPFLTVSHGNSNSRSVWDSMNTVTTGGTHTGIVTNEAWNSFLMSYYSTGHSTKHITDPVGTQPTRDAHAIINYQTPNIEDCYYRMIKAPEVKTAMAFEGNYIVLGDVRQQVKQLGNAVTPPAMEWLVDRAIASLS